MVMELSQLRAMPDARMSEMDIVYERNVRGQVLQKSKDDMVTLDAIMAGDWQTARSYFGVDTTYTQAERQDATLKIQNFIHDAALDIKRVACESKAALRCDILGRSQVAADEARLLEAIGATYWESGSAADLTPALVMDFIGYGGAFLLSYPSPDSPYPRHRRLNPRNVYPTVDSDDDDDLNQLSDCLVAYRMNKRKAAGRWPHIGIERVPTDHDWIEVIEFYDRYQWVKCLWVGDQGFIVEVQDNHIGIVPIAFAKMPTFDGAWRGILLQAAAMMDYQNRIRTLVIDNAEEAAYSAAEKLGVIGGTYGPGGEVELDPQYPNSRYQKIPPAPIQSGMFGIDQRMETDIRGTLGFPAARQGEVSQSIASGSFIEATQGQFSSMVKEAQTAGIAALRRRQTCIDYRLDRTFLNREKPLLVAAGDKTTYTPADDIPDPDIKPYRVQVIYGLLTGVDNLNRTTQLIQLSGARAISRETMRANLDSMGGADWRNEEQKVYREMALDAFMQSRLANPQFPSEQFVAYMDKGKTAEQAASLVAADLAKQQQLMAAQARGPQMPTSPEGGAQAASLAAGGVPGAPSGENQAGQPGAVPPLPALPPLSSVLNQPFTQVRVS